MSHTLVREDGTTTCCDAYTSIDEFGVEYCKRCYYPVEGYAQGRKPTRKPRLRRK